MFRSDDVTCAGRSWTLKKTCAYDWIAAISQDDKDLSRIFPGLIRGRDVETMLECMDFYDDIESRWRNTARVALSRASGRDWWRTVNLVKKCLEGWTAVNGSLLLSGCDSRKMRLSDWLDAAYIQLNRSADDEGRKKLEWDLSRRPRGVSVKQDVAAVKQSLAAFAAD